MLGFHPYFDIQYDYNSGIVNSVLAAIYPKGNSFILNGDIRNRSLENFQGPYWELNPEPPALWCSASNNCATTCLWYGNKHCLFWLPDLFYWVTKYLAWWYEHLPSSVNVKVKPGNVCFSTYSLLSGRDSTQSHKAGLCVLAEVGHQL
jgi:hypothetical protein